MKHKSKLSIVIDLILIAFVVAVTLHYLGELSDAKTEIEVTRNGFEAIACEIILLFVIWEYRKTI